MRDRPGARTRLRILRLARRLRRGALVAHPTGTVPGVAAAPRHAAALARLRRFKKRRGPFLLLAADRAVALRAFRRLPPHLRRAARDCWPGPVTLVAPARPPLQTLGTHGKVGVRVDADPAVRMLARAAGGLVVSTSLNRKGGTPQRPSRRLRYRWRRWLDAVLEGEGGTGAPSTLRLCTPRGLRPLPRRR